MFTTKLGKKLSFVKFIQMMTSAIPHVKEETIITGIYNVCNARGGSVERD